MRAKYTKVLTWGSGGTVVSHWENERGEKVSLKKAPRNYNIDKRLK